MRDNCTDYRDLFLHDRAMMDTRAPVEFHKGAFPGVIHCFTASGAFADIALELVPEVGPLLGKIVVPLVACGMLYAAAAADRADQEEIALDWLRAQLADLRQSAGPAAFETAAAAWFQRLLLQLDEVDAAADEPDARTSGGGDEEAARSVA